MTNLRADPIGDPPPPPDTKLLAGMANARNKMERPKTFRLKTTTKMKELVYSKISNLKANETIANAKVSASPSSTSTDAFQTSTSNETKHSSQVTKIQTSISELFSKKPFPKMIPEHENHTINHLFSEELTESFDKPKNATCNKALLATPKEQTTEMKDDEMTKFSHDPTDAMTGVVLTDIFKHKDSIPPQTAPALPTPFSTAAQELRMNPITHGTAQEICAERIKFEVLIDADAVDDSIIHTKALVSLGRLVNDDPSRKVLPFKTTNEKNWKPLLKT